MSRAWRALGAVVLGFLATHEVSATTFKTALANVAWDEPTATVESAAESAVQLAGDLYATDAESIISGCACEDAAGDNSRAGGICYDSSCWGVDCAAVGGSC